MTRSQNSFIKRLSLSGLIQPALVGIASLLMMLAMAQAGWAQENSTPEQNTKNTTAVAAPDSEAPAPEPPAPPLETPAAPAPEAPAAPAPEAPAAPAPETPAAPAPETPAAPAPETPAAPAPEAPAAPAPETPATPAPEAPAAPAPEAAEQDANQFPVVQSEPNAQTDPAFEPVVTADSPEAEAAAQTAVQEPKLEEIDNRPLLERIRNNSYAIWAIFLIVVALCFWAGNYLAKQWRLPEHNVRIFVVLLAFFGALVAVVLGWNRLTLGIDLQGGVVLVYDTKPLKSSDAGLTNEVMDKLTRAISQRINPGGVREIAITKLGSQQVQVIIPKAEDAEVDRIQRVIAESGALTFRILASNVFPSDANIIARAKREPGRDIRAADGSLEAQWVPVYEGEEGQFFRGDYETRERNGRLEVLVLFNDGVNITGEFLTNVDRGMGEKGPGVSFSFNSVGASKFRRLTSDNRPDPAQPNRLIRHLGIILNDSLYSAPTINTVIGANGIIEFSQRTTREEQLKLTADIDDLIQILNAGALPAELSKEPVSRTLIGATLGTDTIQKGKVALVSSAIVVLIFMLVYYRLAGVVACFCVVTNLLLIVAIMLAIRAAFTLPGLAGLVLTIGMAVDANILIYERLREEFQAGASLKMAIRNAYAKALSAIVDSNLTTILTGIILYSVGTEQVKGFAVTLVLGVSLSMFTAIYCARTIMDIFESQKWCRTFNMLQLFKRPNFDFLAYRWQCAIFSIILTLIAIIATAARGTSLFDIDFVGGVSVEAVFKESQDIGQVRSSLYEKDKTIDDIALRLNDLAVQNVQTGPGQLAGDQLGTGSSAENTRFIITTSIPQVKDKVILPDQYLFTVRNILKDTFGDSLVYCKVDYSVKEIAAPDEKQPGELEVQFKCFPAMNHESLQSALQAAVQKAISAKLLENDFAFSATNENYSLGSQKSYTEWTIKALTSKDNLEKVLGPMKVEQNGTPYFPTSTTVGGSVAKDTRTAGILAVLGSLVCIILYIWFRFHGIVYGLAAVIGLVHDVIVVLGALALSVWLATPLAFLQVNEFKIGLAVVAAFLTIIGYSLNDTIILFDRIRENRGKSPALTYSMINAAINQTLSRTVLTSLTTFLVAIILYFWGGQGIHTFAFAMSVGVAFGTYSTIGLSAPLLFWMVGKNDKEPTTAE